MSSHIFEEKLWDLFCWFSKSSKLSITNILFEPNLSFTLIIYDTKFVFLVLHIGFSDSDIGWSPHLVSVLFFIFIAWIVLSTTTICLCPFEMKVCDRSLCNAKHANSNVHWEISIHMLSILNYAHFFYICLDRITMTSVKQRIE